MDKVVVIVTGGFDPLHSGHLSYINAARALGDILVVGINSDEWLIRKKDRPFMSHQERSAIMAALLGVDYVWTFDDTDGSGKDAIRIARNMFPNSKLIFANGGDRTIENIPEMDIDDDNIEFVFGVGGSNKVNSSSQLLHEWKVPKTTRSWGYYRVLHEQHPEVKLKELVIDPGKCLSMQRHKNRSELWFVAEGVALLKSLADVTTVHKQFDIIHIPKDSWHQLSNASPDVPLKIIEIQYGTECNEEDIERKHNA